MKKTATIIALVLLAALMRTSAQTADQDDLNAGLKAHVGLVARAQDDGILLRWAVDKPAVWQAAASSGYVIERAEAGADGKQPASSAFRAVSAAPILPWTPTQWETYFATAPAAIDGQPDYAMVAAAMCEKSEGEAAVQLDNLAALKEQKARFEMSYGLALYAADRSSAAAEGLGLRFLDKTAEKGKTYIYRVRLAGASSVYRVDTGMVNITFTPLRAASGNLVRATENDGWILLTWPGRKYSATRVERSTDGGKNFSPLTNRPVMSVHAEDSHDSTESFSDTLVTNYKPYVYRVHGATAFADEELIGEVKAMGRDRTPPEKPFVPNAKQIAARAVRIVWSMDEPVAEDLSGFRVFRDSIEDGKYIPLTQGMLSKNAREFIDTTFAEHDPNYYVVAAYDTAGNVARSMPSYVAIVDSTSPGVPRWFKGTMDSTGVVTLVLRANPERDAMGYRIMRANAPEHEFSTVREWFGQDGRSAAKDTVITDTVAIQSLTKNVYYRATALDFNFNESEMSDILTVPRPDLVPPVAPVITDVDVTDTSVAIFFTPGGSPDVASHLLYKRSSGDASWGTPVTIAADARSAIDKDVKSNVTYEYALQAVDSAGNKSEKSMTVLARPYMNAVLPAVSDLTVRYDDSKKQMVLNWRYDRETEGQRFMIYRSLNGSGLKKYAAANNSTIRTFIDASLPGKGVYEYAIKVMSTTGAESGMSAVVKSEVK